MSMAPFDLTQFSKDMYAGNTAPYEQYRNAPPQDVNPQATPNMSVAPTGGQVLGTNTGGGTPAPQQSQQSGPSPEQQRQAELENRIRGEINQGYDVLGGKLNEILTGLPSQADIQRRLVEEQLGRGTEQLGSRYDIGTSQLQGQEEKVMGAQKKNLKTLAESQRNQALAFQNRLGTMGAGDSSALNMGAYAYTKLGNKARGDLMTGTAEQVGDINQRRFELKTTYDSGMKDIESESNSKMLQIEQWLAEQQDTIRQMQGEAGVNRGRDLSALSQQLLGQAMAAANAVRETALNRKSMLDQWAMQNSTNLSQLEANMKGVSGVNYTPAAFQGLNAPTSVGNVGQMRSMWGGGAEDEQNYFG